MTKPHNNFARGVDRREPDVASNSNGALEAGATKWPAGSDVGASGSAGSAANHPGTPLHVSAGRGQSFMGECGLTEPDRAPRPPLGSGLALAPAIAIANIRRALNEAHDALIYGNFEGMLGALEEIEGMVGELERAQT